MPPLEQGAISPLGGNAGESKNPLDNVAVLEKMPRQVLRQWLPRLLHVAYKNISKRRGVSATVCESQLTIGFHVSRLLRVGFLAVFRLLRRRGVRGGSGQGEEVSKHRSDRFVQEGVEGICLEQFLHEEIMQTPA